MKLVYLIPVAIVITIVIYLYGPREDFLRHNCDLAQGPCVLNNDNVKLKFEILPRKLSSKMPAIYRLDIDGFTPENVVVHLIGKSMHMEEEYIKLTKVNKGVFKTVRDFPTCSEKNMTWKAILLLKKDNHYIKSIFNLKTYK